jgi:hypothetical protein
MISFLNTSLLVCYFDHVNEKFVQKRKDVATINTTYDETIHIQGSLFVMTISLIIYTLIVLIIVVKILMIKSILFSAMCSIL